MVKQHTLKSVIHATGVGTHGGEKVYLTLRPASVNTGIVFKRVDLDDPVSIPAHANYISDTTMCTTISHNGVSVSTIEHLMSAFAGMGIDNAFVDVSASEIPIMDGSSAPFVFLLQSAGIVSQVAEKKFIRIKKEVIVRDGDKVAKIKPHNGFRVEFGIAYDHPLFNDSNQTCVVDFGKSLYTKDIARARTFGFISDYETLRKNNLANGTSLDNTIAIDKYNILNNDGLRYTDECVRHKILDVVGDLYLLGHAVIGDFYGYKSGHRLNKILLKELLSREDAWEIISLTDEESSPIHFTWSEVFA